MTLRDKAAAALDRTHQIADCGPRTMKTRATLAEWLDGQRKLQKSTVRILVGYLDIALQREGA